MIKNIVFDIGKVLFGFDWDQYMQSMFDAETSEIVTAAVFGGRWWKELDRAVIPESEILDRFIEAAPDYETEIRQAFFGIGRCISKRDWVIPLIESLKDRGYNVYFLSNMSEHVMGSNPDAFAFTGYMDGGVFSCDVKVIKPDPDIYRLLFAKYDLVPEECIFIDDKSPNIAMAKRLGMKAIRFRSHEQLMLNLSQALLKDRTHDCVTVLCYGDSNTYGYDPDTGGRYPCDKRWTSILERLLNEKQAKLSINDGFPGNKYEVIPEGLNGRTTAFDRPEAPWKNGLSSIQATLGTHKPVDYLIIMLGTNDCNAELGLNADDIACGMERLVCAAEEISPELQGYIPEIIVVSPPAIQGDYERSPFASRLTPESVQNSLDIQPLYKQIADRHLCHFVDAALGIEVSPGDCEHLTEKGHRRLAELLFEAVTNSL